MLAAWPARRRFAMNAGGRLGGLIDSLAVEVAGVQPGSTQGQFPILDLLGNLRDEAAGDPELSPLRDRCALTWGKLIQIVESGQPFAAEHVPWLNASLQEIRALSGPVGVEGERAGQTRAAGRIPAGLADDADNEGAPLTLKLPEDGDLLREFIAESRDHLDQIEQGALVLENRPRDAETLNTIFRAFHTFKGSAGFLNLAPINRLAHLLESFLDRARQGTLEMDRPAIELILRGRDVLKQFLDAIERQVNGAAPLEPISIPTAGFQSEVRRMLDRFTLEKIPGEPTVQESNLPPEALAAIAVEPASMVKVATAKLDNLVDLVGEMVVAQSLIGLDLERLAGMSPRSARNVARLARITGELQRVSLSLRMVPIRGLFQKMSRVVRDIGARQQKEIHLVTAGEDTELDRHLVEILGDPLLHMIRNSIDHGIEAAAQRVAVGKAPAGTVQLRASHRGGNILIELSDDGAGLNRGRILSKAIERGLAPPGSVLSDQEIFELIFAPGFSTAEVVTDLSGRGVGLDVVRRNLEEVGGSVEVSSEPGKGTLFKLTLPLTLAIIDALVVQVGEGHYLVPTLAVRESFRLHPEMVTRIHDRGEVVNVRGRLIPLLRLRDYFGLGPASTEENIGIVVQSVAGLRCLIVDRLLRKQEAVIKNLDDLKVHDNRALAGAAILGDGRVGLVLDINGLN